MIDEWMQKNNNLNSNILIQNRVKLIGVTQLNDIIVLVLLSS